MPENLQDYLDRVKGADIFCSGTAGLQDVTSQLHDVYITVSFVSVAFIDDLELLRKNNVLVSNTPGINRFAVSEWIMRMALQLSRQFDFFKNRVEAYRDPSKLPPISKGLAGYNMTILGFGAIAKRVGELAACFGMNVKYFKRGDDLYHSLSDADIVVDALSSNPSTRKLLAAKFFDSFKNDSYFITVSRSEVLDEDALIAALDSGKLLGAASDCASVLDGDTNDGYYKKLLAHPKITVTAHNAFRTLDTIKRGNDAMLDNVQAWVSGSPINVVN